MHRVGPFGTVEVRYGKLHEEVAERCGIENRCVEKGREIAQRSVSHLELLALCGTPIEHLAAVRIDVLLESQNVLEADPAVRSHHAEGNLLLLKELNDERPRDVEKVGSLLRGELSVLRNDGDRATRRHILQNSLKKPHGA